MLIIFHHREILQAVGQQLDHLLHPVVVENPIALQMEHIDQQVVVYSIMAAHPLQ
tara:strand:- start:35 stop:199 length:165 start_codon:yes stop_codon:yes gene_type:complete